MTDVTDVAAEPCCCRTCGSQGFCPMLRAQAAPIVLADAGIALPPRSSGPMPCGGGAWQPRRHRPAGPPERFFETAQAPSGRRPSSVPLNPKGLPR